MVNFKQMSNKITFTPKFSIQTRQTSAQETPATSSANDDQEGLVITIKKIIKEQFDKQEKKIDKKVKLHSQPANKRTDKIFKYVIEVTKSLEFTQSTLDEELGIV